MHLSSLGSLVAFSALVSGAVARTTGRINYAKLAQRNNSIAASVDSQHPIKPKCGGLPEPEPETPLSCDQFWLENIDHQGKAPYATFPNYQVWRNVKDFGAVGDGIQDDTKAINDAISFGDRCGPGTCNGSTTTPALIYFPSGTYLVSEPIIDYYYTQLIGNPIPACRPVFKAAETFVAPWVLDSNPYGYQPNGAQAWGATNVFWRQVANFVFDLTSVPPESEIRAIHWPSSQATSLSNIEINLSAAANTNHRGLFIENGSGGYVGDITVNGGYWGLEIGNQQFTFRNITVNNAKVAIKQLWSWGWTYMGIAINNCGVGFDFTAGNATTGELTVGTITILDSDIRNTPIGIQYGLPVPSFPPQANTFIFENIRLENVPAAILGPDGQVVLSGTPTRTLIEAWGRGNAYSSSGGPEPFQGLFPPVQRPGSLTVSSSNGDYYTASKPYYQNHPVSSFYTARQFHAKGDGETDDTEALNELFSKAAKHHKIVYINAGIYKVTRTIQIPPGSRIFGDSSFPQIVSSGSYFQDESKPKPVIQVGSRGSKGRIEWSNTIVSTRGRQPGAILIEYNLKTPIDAGKSSHGVKPSGMWDVHVRVGGFAGSDLQLTQCAKTPQKTITPDNLDRDCVAAFMSWHLTPESGGLYQENNWVWVADHDIEEPANNEQITIYAGRGLLLESRDGPNWLVASSVEHHQRYEYQLWKTRNVFAGQIQTETAYYQPNPDVNLPFAADEKYHDPIFGQGESGWGLRVVNSKDVAIYGAGLYSFFDNYNVTCSQIGEGSRCQKRTFSVEGDTERLRVYNLNTVGTTNMITVNGVDTGLYSDNQDGFVQSIAIFSDIDIIS